MEKIIGFSQIILAVLLMTTVLLQHRGTGLGGAFASEANVYRSKRGIEKFLFYLTIILAVLFVITAVINIVIRT